MKIRILTFSDRGENVAEKLCRHLLKTDEADYMRCGETITLSGWTAENFPVADALIFVGACGIAVRAVAPFLESKATDPAVIVVDELEHYVIPILSGHLGGANDLAVRIAHLLSAEAVITTATDINGVFAIDSWAGYQDMCVLDTDKIKSVSARLLDGGSIRIKSNFPIVGKEPAGVILTSEDTADVHVSTRRKGIFGDRTSKDPLIIVPHIAVLGIGCRKGTSAVTLERCFERVMEELDIFEEAFYKVCTIDLKKNEPGIHEFCRTHGFSVTAFSAEELKKVPGEFSGSAFVEDITGVDNVCERSAVLGAGDGRLVMKKTAWEGATMAVAFKNISLDWKWRND